MDLENFEKRKSWKLDELNKLIDFYYNKICQQLTDQKRPIITGKKKTEGKILWANTVEKPETVVYDGTPTL